MINQVKPSISNSPNVFASFNTSGVNYAITRPFDENSIKKTQKHNEEKEKRNNSLGLSIALASLAAGAGVLAILKGLPRGSYSKINKVFRSVEDKITTLSNKAQLNTVQVFYLSALKGAKSLINRTKATFTAGTMKDILLKKNLEKVPYAKKFGPWITNVFEKISVKTSKKSYVQTAGRFDDVFTTFAEQNQKLKVRNQSEIVTIDGQSKTVAEWVKILDNKTKNIQHNFDNGFRESKRRARLAGVKKDLNGIDDKVWSSTFGDLKGFVTDKQTYQTFLAEELAAPAKIKLGNKVNKIRASITNDIDDNYKATKKILGNIDGFINPADGNSRGLIKEIRKTLDEYKVLSGAEEVAKRAELNKQLALKLQELNQNILKTNLEKPSTYDVKTVEQVSGYIENLGGMLKNNKKGEMQQVLTIYKHLLPSEKEYLTVKNEAYKAIKSLDKSIDLETDKLFDKLRDLKIGSALTDVFGVLTSGGVIAWGLTKADNSDERTSVALKYGIPALGAMLTSLYCTVGLISGGTALALGMVSGLALNKIGEATDKSIKKYKENPVELSKIALTEASPASAQKN